MLLHKTVKTALTQAIRNDIVSGYFAPSTHLQLDKLAGQYDVSTMPIREALRLLEAEGIVYSVPHRGSYVTSFTTEELLDIYEMRAMLEKMATRDAVSRLNDDVIQYLQMLVDTWHIEPRNPALVIEQNANFHMTIYQSAERPHLYGEILKLRNRTQHYLHSYCEKYQQFERAKEEHQAILHAIKECDADVASQLCYDHVWRVGQALADYVREGLA